MDKFIYLGSSISSTDNNINKPLAKACSAIDRLSVRWKSDPSDKIKRNFFQAAVVSIILYGCTRWKLSKRMEKKTWLKLHKNATSHTEQILEATFLPYLKLFISDEHDEQNTAGDIRANS